MMVEEAENEEKENKQDKEKHYLEVEEVVLEGKV